MKDRILITSILTLSMYLGSYGVMFAEEASVEVAPAAQQGSTSSESQASTGTSEVDAIEQSSTDQTQTTAGEDTTVQTDEKDPKIDQSSQEKTKQTEESVV